jgi:hypothetical protein
MQGILFDYELGMFPAVVAETKTETRRLVDRALPVITEYTTGYTAFTPKGHVSLRGNYMDGNESKYGEWFVKTRYKKGEILFLKEPYCFRGVESLIQTTPIYKYFNETENAGKNLQWNNKMFVGAKYARYYIEILDVQIEPLHDITEEACIKEGIIQVTKDDKVFKYCVYDKGDYSSVPWSDMPYTAKEAYQWLWDKINKKKAPWSLNPWVIVYKFKKVNSDKS